MQRRITSSLFNHRIGRWENMLKAICCRLCPGEAHVDDAMAVARRELLYAMIHFVTGDMFDVAADIRVNTANCVGVTGAGVAFKKRFPKVFAAYREACRRGEYTPGCIQVYRSYGHE